MRWLLNSELLLIQLVWHFEHVACTRPNVPLSFVPAENVSYEIGESTQEGKALVNNLQEEETATTDTAVSAVNVTTSIPFSAAFVWGDFLNQMVQTRKDTRVFSQKIVNFVNKNTVSHLVVSLPFNLREMSPSSSRLYTQLVSHLPEGVRVKLCPYLGTEYDRNLFGNYSPRGDALEGVFAYAAYWNAEVTRLAEWGKSASLGFGDNIFGGIVLDLSQFTQDELMLHNKDIARLKQVYGIKELSVLMEIKHRDIFRYYKRIGIDKFYVKNPVISTPEIAFVFLNYAHLIYPVWSQNMSSKFSTVSEQGLIYS